MCAFWLLEAMTAGGNGPIRRDAIKRECCFERMLGEFESFGLYAESDDFSGGYAGEIFRSRLPFSADYRRLTWTGTLGWGRNKWK